MCHFFIFTLLGNLAPSKERCHLNMTQLWGWAIVLAAVGSHSASGGPLLHVAPPRSVPPTSCLSHLSFQIKTKKPKKYTHKKDNYVINRSQKPVLSCSLFIREKLIAMFFYSDFCGLCVICSLLLSVVSCQEPIYVFRAEWMLQWVAIRKGGLGLAG